MQQEKKFEIHFFMRHTIRMRDEAVQRCQMKAKRKIDIVNITAKKQKTRTAYVSDCIQSAVHTTTHTSQHRNGKFQCGTEQFTRLSSYTK